MRSRDLKTKPEIIVSNYTIVPHSSGQFLHRFTPNSTSTIYQFCGAEDPRLEEGKAYNIGYSTDEDGQNRVDTSSIAKADDVVPLASHQYARQCGEQIRAVETQNSDERITHTATDGHYLGKKYAWRIYGMALPREDFDAYLEEIDHPSVPCVIQTQDSTESPSTAYKEEGLETAIDTLIDSCTRIRGIRFCSTLFPSKNYFFVKGIPAITDKK